MSKFSKIENTVLPIMMAEPRARDDDNYLFAEYIKATHPEIAEVDFYNAMVRFSKDINIKSVERVRRKLQQKYPELRGKTYEKRHSLEQDYIDYNNATNFIV